MNDDMEIGKVVLAKAGRDKGRHFVIVGRIDKDYVLIADGRTRSIDKPKKKKIKHLEARPHVVYDVREKILNNQKVFDAELRKSLEALGYEQ